MADIEMTTAINNASQPSQPSDQKPSRLRERDVSKYVPDRDSVGEIRNSLLVVSALITAATFAVGVNPPGGVWQDDRRDDHLAGRSVLASYSKASFTMFLFSNSAAFSSSILVIGRLVLDFPYRLEIWLAMACMSFTYGVAISSVSPPGEIKTRYVYLAILLPYIVRFAYEVIKRIWKLLAGKK